MQKAPLGREIHSLSNLIMRYVENTSAKKQIESITGTNSWIIKYIDDHKDTDIFQRDLERKFGITRSTASKVINLMVEKGLILRESVSYDARLKKLVLTPKAQKIAQRITQDVQEIDAAISRGFSEEELKLLHQYIKRIKQNVTYY